jgi:hypothetical protein
LSGVPLSETDSIKSNSPLDLTWSVDRPGDTVYVELGGTKSSNRAVCAFADELGAGSVPTDGFEPGETGHFSVHRLRSHTFAVFEEEGHGQLRFDFAVTRNVTFE